MTKPIKRIGEPGLQDVPRENQPTSQVEPTSGPRTVRSAQFPRMTHRRRATVGAALRTPRGVRLRCLGFLRSTRLCGGRWRRPEVPGTTPWRPRHMQQEMPQDYVSMKVQGRTYRNGAGRCAHSLVAVGCMVCGCGHIVRPSVVDAVAPVRTAASLVSAPAAFVTVLKTYANCHAYRDRGTVVDTSWTLDGTSNVIVARFDTLFLRGRGLRFRYYDESGTLRHALWAWDGRAQEWWWRAALEPMDASTMAVLAWISSARGVTNLTSWYVPTLLFDRAPECEAGSWNLLPKSWERATTVIFRDASQDVTTEFTMDLRAGVVRRVYRVAKFFHRRCINNVGTRADDHTSGTALAWCVQNGHVDSV